MDVTVPGMVMLFSALQSRNSPGVISVSPPGRVTEVSFLQAVNVNQPGLVTLSGIVTSVSSVQNSNAFDPMAVILSGMTMLFRLHLTNPLYAISVTGFPLCSAGMTMRDLPVALPALTA